MPSAKIRPQFDRRSLLGDGGAVEFHDQIAAASFSDVVFGYFDNNGAGESAFPASSSQGNEIDLDDDEEKENGNCGGEDDSFWENQSLLLQATLCRTTSLESGIRNVVKETLKEVQINGKICGCGRLMAGGCRNCLMAEVSGRLRTAGYNSAFCKSKWKNSDIPSGEHTFVDVIDNSNHKKGEVRVIIELNFRSEFEIAKASEEYNRLVRRLPEVFVGKVERLQTVIKILCLAAKKCMKEKKMHLGPWRKQRYMQAKWLGACKRTASPATFTAGCDAGRVAKPKASMLTVDFLDVLPNVHCTAVAVV